MSKRTLPSRYEEGTRFFFITIQVCQTQWDHFQYKTLCFWWCIYSCYSLHSMKSLCILQSVSSGLKLLNSFAHCCANEISDLGKSAYLNYAKNYAKNSSCRLLCINALLIHHIIFNTVSMNLVRTKKLASQLVLLKSASSDYSRQLGSQLLHKISFMLSDVE